MNRIYIMAMVLLLWNTGTTWSAEPAGTTEKPQLPATVATTGDSSEFQIPANATPAVLLEFARKLMTTEKSFPTEAEYTAWLKKMFQTVLSITETVLKQQTDDPIFFSACGIRGQILAYMATTDPSFRPLFNDYVKALESNPRVQNNKDGKTMTLSFRGIAFQDQIAAVVRGNNDVEEFRKVLKEIQLFIMQYPQMSDMVYDLIYPVNLLAESNKKPELVGEILGKLYKILKDSAAPEHQRVAKGLEGAIRFTELQGKELPIEGAAIDGKVFDPAVLKGKVTILVFQAVWSTPCKLIYPEILALYQKYHDKGLEIVGYSVDNDVTKLKEYLASDNIPWSILSEAVSVTNKQTSLREHYGIIEIPTLIVIGRDGKVVNQHLDIDTLKELIEQMFK